MKTKYDLMNESAQCDENNNPYADLASFDINKFSNDTKPYNYKLSEKDCLRHDNTSYEFYEKFNLYEDINLWLNSCPLITRNILKDDYEYCGEVETISNLPSTGSNIVYWVISEHKFYIAKTANDWNEVEDDDFQLENYEKIMKYYTKKDIDSFYKDTSK